MGSQKAVAPVTSEEVTAVCKFFCRYADCDHCFTTKRGLLVHEGRCEWKDECDFEKILSHKDSITTRKYLVKWKDCDERTWESHNNIHHEVVKEYEQAADIYDEE